MIHLQREDLLHPFISGNKLRKLKHPLLDAVEKGCSTLVTFGGAFSNHLLATACAGAEKGFKTVGIVRGERPEPINDVLFLCEMFGMELRFISRDDYRRKPEYFENNFNAATHYFIDEGGRGELAVKGVEEAVAAWQKADHIILGVGTGATLAGVIRGVNALNLKTKVHGISMIKGFTEIESEISDLLPYNCSAQWEVHHDFHRGGYAKMDQDLITYIKSYAAKKGIILDPVYMGKVLMAAEKMIDDHIIPPNDSVLVIHTGGWTGILGAKSKFL
ncbi:MAG: 1-aminocyclopropane-1-carboxylate deaminase [Sphingobacteriales bacterium]|jgi:1-aminocyclopropane-1-carboxylate deaminase